MGLRLRESEEFPTARVVGWESRNGDYHRVYDSDMGKVGRNPTDHSLESADRVVIHHNGDFYTVDALTPDYDLTEAIKELEDYYSQVSG